MFLLFTVLSSPSNLNMPHGVKISFFSLKFCVSRFSQNPKNRKIETKTQNHNPTVQAIKNQRSQITIRVTQPNWPIQLSTPYKTPTTPTHLLSHSTLFSKKLNQFPLKNLLSIPKRFLSHFLQWPEEANLSPQAPPRRAHLGAARPVSSSPSAVSPVSSKPASTPNASAVAPLSTSPPSSSISPPRSVYSF